MRLLALMYRDSDKKLIYQLFGGEPIKLRWGAWVSDTYLLQRDGWQFNAEEHYEAYMNCHAIRLAVTAPDKNLIISGVLRMSREEMVGHYNYNRFSDRPVEMQQYHSPRDVFRYADREEINSWSAMQAVDMTIPTTATDRQIAMRDFKFLAPAANAKNEIYIPEANVDELLNQILKIQYPEQQQIKKGLIMPEAKPIIQAKIFSLAA
jgi:hypothetical protein